MTGQNPYRGLPPESFWRTAVANKSPFQIADHWRPKHAIEKDDCILTAGSCFAQHIGRALKANGFAWVDAEPGPHMLPRAEWARYGYGIFSFRTGNIYTAAALRQWLAYAFGLEVAPDEVWEQDGRFFDPLRPTIEPRGFASLAELKKTRELSLRCIARSIPTCDVFVFTLGLTEAWINRDTGLTYSICPGTTAGEFDPDVHLFKNYDYAENLELLNKVFAIIKSVNSKVRFLLTVSPVPLTATAAPQQHVLTATTYSKSVLRAVAGALCEQREDVDYFPSYEIITAFPFRGMFYDPNLRTVAPDGVSFVMKNFFDGLQRQLPEPAKPAISPPPVTRGAPKPTEEGDVICDEEILDGFNRS